LQPVPAAAERWEISEDRMTWTFHIRRSARFSNGDPLLAQDFAAAWLSLLDPQRSSPYSGFFDVITGARDYRNGVNSDPETVGIQVTSPRTLVVRLNSPASFFPAMLCHHSFSPIHSSMINNDNWGPGENPQDWQPPVSNGAYRIVAMNEERISLVKCDWYWDRQRVAIDRITIRFAETPEEASYLWNSGEARWIAGNVNIDMLTDRSGIQVNILFATHYYFIRSSQPPWNDARVRRAMALVLPWEEIRSGYYLPAHSLIYPISGYPEVIGIIESDYEEARRLITEAGFEDGIGLPELVIRITPSRDAARVGALMAGAWRDRLGFNVRIEIVPFDNYFASLKDDGYTVGSSTWIGDFADPYAFLQLFRRDSNLNDSRFDDDEYEALIERSMLEDDETRLATLAEAERLLLQRAVVLPICYNPALNIIDIGEIAGWFPNALDLHPLKYLSFRDFRPLPGVALIN
jgi:peptide/nickel transport system substrate-binding protein/oligopeptide transport system substrate-binding protein